MCGMLTGIMGLWPMGSADPVVALGRGPRRRFSISSRTRTQAGKKDGGCSRPPVVSRLLGGKYSTKQSNYYRVVASSLYGILYRVVILQHIIGRINES